MLRARLYPQLYVEYTSSTLSARGLWVILVMCAQAHRHLHALHELCWALGSLRLHHLDAAQAPRLSAFAADQAAALRMAGAALAGFDAAVADVMVAGCTEALQALQDRLDQFALRQVRGRS